MQPSLNRRSFMGAAAAGAFTIVPRHVLGGPGNVAPSDKITLAQIGFGTQAVRELGGLLGEPKIQIVAVCDPNADTSDYVEWGKGEIRKRIQGYVGDPNWRKGDEGCPGGRDVGRAVVDGYYARHRKADKFAACAAWEDFREMLDKQKDLDAVKILVPDHLHAAISIAAMNKGKHVLLHKPIANRLAEGRKVIEKARQAKVATYLLAYGSGAGNAAIVERIKQGAIGKLREVHNWTNRPVWPQYTEVPADRPAAPKGFNWDLWLGPVTDRPYHPHYTHTVYRGWYDFGGGSMADMGYYSLWPVFTGLDLDAPLSAEAWGTHTCRVTDCVSRVAANDFAYPTACTIRLRFAARAERPAIDLFWYDGGMKPRLPEELEAQDAAMGKEGILFVGDQGAILAGFLGQDPQLFARGKREALKTQSAMPAGAWLEAMRGGPPSPGSFLNAAAIADAVNLGTVALRTGRKVLFDSSQMRITNVGEANRLLAREYRPGWVL
ncbi:MAG: Glucose--fructose oxidoreductase precursor [Planctomycetes bacterium ADurb.Bin126]|nr:MAG: Glucose--fructose oxidoreductase precursor [Planctomycetes bacterium ADurb.Bin126]HOD80113.1 Gfo/Idh/MocA family oxidoreductase [Phycisphaerae bacterium]HQL75246.1 Gfo/Idh/MocA family oxidoreductase [Phycisphaerae bacterium]